MDTVNHVYDFVVVGSGVAGLHAAERAAGFGRVALITQGALRSGSSYWAQGGVAAVIAENDSFDLHIQDTLAAGRGLCDAAAVGVLVRDGAADVQALIDEGMPFDRAGRDLSLSLEGGHSRARILHGLGIQTGKALVDFLVPRVEAEPNITVFEHTTIARLLMADNGCAGVLAWQHESIGGDGQPLRIHGRATILATGGYSALYQRTTNPHTSVGDGLALAYEAGAALQDLEFVQFHPTALYTESGETFLVSEALRGAGATLHNAAGDRFMAGFAQAELTPRDWVAREIVAQIEAQTARGEPPFVWLDARMIDATILRDHFGHIVDRLAEHGVDATRDLIPVAPAAHYCVGGVATDLDGQSTVDHLYVCGEAAATGVHGANRLASNSLLECLVFARRAVAHAAARPDRPHAPVDADDSAALNADRAGAFVRQAETVADLLNTRVGVQRDRAGLVAARDTLLAWTRQLPVDDNEYFTRRQWHLLSLATLITEAALARCESRGVHLRRDYPESDSKATHSQRRRPAPLAQRSA